MADGPDAVARQANQAIELAQVIVAKISDLAADRLLLLPWTSTPLLTVRADEAYNRISFQDHA